MSVQYLPDLLRDVERPRALELGSREVTGSSWARPPSWDCVGVDIVPGPGVDLVADAHELSQHVPRESFDAVFSSSVFEHLVMPWKVVLELNAILRTGGVAWIGTHDNFPVHEWPWDFFRFGEDVWPTLFSARTGFEIIGSRPLQPCRVRPDAPVLPTFASHAGTEVQARKIGPPLPGVHWDVSPRQVLPPGHFYPTGVGLWPERTRAALRHVARAVGIGPRRASRDDPWKIVALPVARWLVATGPTARKLPLPGDVVDAGAALRARLAELPAGGIGGVALLGALELEPEPWALVAELHRALAPGGIVYVDTVQAAPTRAGSPSLWRFSSEALLALFHEASGFTMLRRTMLDPCAVEDPASPPGRGARAYLRTLGLARKSGAFDHARLSWS
jgi:SAM-dependent methyltransferase